MAFGFHSLSASQKRFVLDRLEEHGVPANHANWQSIDQQLRVARWLDGKPALSWEEASEAVESLAAAGELRLPRIVKDPGAEVIVDDVKFSTPFGHKQWMGELDEGRRAVTRNHPGFQLFVEEISSNWLGGKTYRISMTGTPEAKSEFRDWYQRRLDDMR